MIIKAHAKISLAIDVKAKDENGYHLVDNISLPIDLHDVIEVKPIIGGDALYLTCDDPTIVCDETEHAYEAFNLMKKAFDLKRGYTFQIYKRIPSKSGLGGGAADAAGVIKGLCKVFKIPLDDPKVLEIVPKVGKNTFFFLNNDPARLTQEGNIVQPLPDLKLNYYVLIVRPLIGLEAKDVFEAYDKLPEALRIHPNIDHILDVLKSGDEDLIGQNLDNSLLGPAISLDGKIKEILEDMHAFGIKIAMMSGTGSACFGLSKDKRLLKRAQQEFHKKGYPTLITSTILKK